MQSESSIGEITKTFFCSFPVRHYMAGEVIARPGSPTPGILYLVSGSVIQFDISARGEQVIVNTFLPGAFFPMSQALIGEPSPFFFAAESDATLHVCPAAEAITFLERNPAITIDLLTRVYRGSEGILRRLAYTLGGTGQSAVIHELLVLARRAKTSDPLQVSHQQIADRVGLTRETVSRELGLLAKKGLIVLGYRKIAIPNLAALEAFLHA